MNRRRASNGLSLALLAAWVLFPLALAPGAVAVGGELNARLAAATDVELAAELAREDTALLRFEIAREMARRGAERFTHLWEPRLHAEDFPDRLGAGLVLARSGDDRGLELVLAELAEATFAVKVPPVSMDPQERKGRFQQSHHRRYLAALTLGSIGDSRAVEPLIEGIRDPSLAYRAAMSLGEIGDRRAITELREMARAIPEDRHWAGWALAMLGERGGWDLLIEVVGDSDLHWAERRHAVVALGELADTVAVEPLAGLLASDVDVHLRVAAARALGQIGDPAALPVLRVALDDEEPTIDKRGPTVAVVAAEAIRRIEARGPLEIWSPPPGRE